MASNVNYDTHTHTMLLNGTQLWKSLSFVGYDFGHNSTSCCSNLSLILLRTSPPQKEKIKSVIYIVRHQTPNWRQRCLHLPIGGKTMHTQNQE